MKRGCAACLSPGLEVDEDDGRDKFVVFGEGAKKSGKANDDGQGEEEQYDLEGLSSGSSGGAK